MLPVDESVGQADAPALALGLLIRAGRMNARIRGQGDETLVESLGCMTLVRVQQRRGAGVKIDCGLIQETGEHELEGAALNSAAH